MTPQEKETAVLIHNAIHNPKAKEVVIDGHYYPILRGDNGCRYVEWNNIKWMEQNPAKNSQWATRCRMGDEITWGIVPGNWILIINGEVK